MYAERPPGGRSELPAATRRDAGVRRGRDEEPPARLRPGVLRCRELRRGETVREKLALDRTQQHPGGFRIHGDRGTVDGVGSPEQKFLRAPLGGATARSLLLAALWFMVGILIGGVVVVAAGVMAAAVAGVAWLVGRGTGELADGQLIWRVVTFAAVAVAPLVVGVVVWVAAYGSTERGSRPRALAGIGAASVGLAGYLLLGSSGLILAALTLGWSLAVPAERVGRIAARVVLGLVAALFMPAIGGVSVGWLVLTLVTSPWAAVAFMLAGDAAWMAIARLAESRAPGPG